MHVWYGVGLSRMMGKQNVTPIVMTSSVKTVVGVPGKILFSFHWEMLGALAMLLRGDPGHSPYVIVFLPSWGDPGHSPCYHFQ